MSLRYTCRDCGYAGTYKTTAQAEHHFGRHSCRNELERQARMRRVRRAKAERANRGPVRDCLCPIARHEHGTRQAYVIDSCRCGPCLDATVEYERQRRRRVLYGRDTGRTAAEPVRAHLFALQAQGMAYKQAARIAGVSLTTVSQVMYGRPDRRGHRPPYTVAAHIAEKLLAVVPDPFALSDRARVDATGTHRRVQALVTLGWSQSVLCARLGMCRANFGTMMRAAHVHAKTARAVRDLYEQLWDTRPPASAHRERISVTRAKRYAAERRWLPPLAYDDGAIDDPTWSPSIPGDTPDVDEVAVQRLISGDPPASYTRSERDEAVHRLTALGYSARQIAERLGRSQRGISRDRAKGLDGAA